MRTGRRETPDERVDRELNEFAQELRVSVSGVQVLFGFLLIVAFNERFRMLDPTERRVYFTAVGATTISLVLYLAPAIHHRLRFRSGDKEQILLVGTALCAVAAAALAIAIMASLHVVTYVVFGADTANLAVAILGALIALLWFVVPFLFRHPPETPDPQPAEPERAHAG